MPSPEELIIEKADIVLDPIFDGVKIKHFNDNGTIDADTPIDLILDDQVAVEADHVAELKANMEEKAREFEAKGQRNPTGQLAAVFLGQVPGEVKFPIIDGFHRTAVIRPRNHRSVVDSRISPAISWEEVFNQRILAAASHKGVKFARVVEWIESVWKLSPWGEQISALQAFSLATNQRLTGEKLGIKKTEVPDIMDWAEAHCRAWGGISTGSVFNDLRAAQNVDPTLLRAARLNDSGQGIISPAHLKSLGALLPNDYDSQNIVADIIRENDLTVSEVKTLTTLVAAIGTGAKLQKAVETRVWERLEPPLRSTGRPRNDGAIKHGRKSPAEQMDFIKHELLTSEIETCLLALQNIIFRARYIAPPIGSRLDPRVPEIKGIIAPNPPLTPVDRSAFETQMEVIREEALSNLKPRMGEEKAEEVIQTVIDRLAEDLYHGGLRYGLITSKGQINKLFTATLTPELSKWASQNTGEDETLAVQPDVPRISVVSLNVEGMLPELSSAERRALVLGSAFNLANFTIAQLTNLQPIEISRIWDKLYKEFKATSRLVETEGKRPVVHRKGDKINVEIDDDIANPYGLTPSELPIAYLISLGLTNGEIGRARIISEETVKSHVRHMRDKTGSRSRAELVSRLHDTGTMQGVRLQPDQSG